MKIRLLCTILTFFIFTSAFSDVPSVRANETGDESNFICFVTVTEQNGISLDGFLAQRGVPLCDNIINENDSVYLINPQTGEEISVQHKILETYESGYASWILLSFVCNLKPYDNLSFKLYKGSGNKAKGEAIARMDSDGKITVNNGRFVAEFDSMGLSCVSLGNRKVFSHGGADSVYVEKNISYGVSDTKVWIVDNGHVYAKIKFSAGYGEGAMRIEKTYTFSAMSDLVECTTLYVSSNGTYRSSRNWGYDTVNSMYDTFSLSEGDWQVSFQNLQASKDDKIKSVGYVNAYNPYDNISFSVISRDVEKFRSALTKETSNGFLYLNGDIIYSPLIYESSYNWQDGAKKSTHCILQFSEGKSANCDEIYLTLCNMPAVMPEKKAFTDAGIIASNSVSAIGQAQIEEIKWTKERRGGKFDAGAIPFYVNSLENYMGADLSVRLGEVEYNVWLAAIASGDAQLFDIVNESTEAWADIEIYQGTVKEARGYTRYRSGSGSDAAISHGYYGECSSLYIAYLLTGNDYYKEQLYSVADLQARLSSVAANINGNEMYYQGGWSDSRMGVKGDLRNIETRFAFMLRAVYNAYKLFKDERFLNLALNMNNWTASAQEEDGSWAQMYSSYNLNQRQSKLGVPAYKNYIMLYTLRAHCDLWCQTGDETAKEQILKFSDYLIKELGDNDWTWDPNNSDGKNMTGEDYSRGKAPIQEAMEAEIFLTAFKASGEEKYFEALCRVLSNYIATMLPTGFAPQRYNHKDYLKGQINSVISGQNTTLMRIDAELCKLFGEKRDLALKLGFGGLVAIYADGASLKNDDLYHEFQSIELGANLFEAPSGRYLFVSNNSGYNSGKWDKEVKIHIAGSSNLWSGFKCSISNSFETVVFGDMKTFESVYAAELPIKVTPLGNQIVAEVIKYDAEEIVLKFCSDAGSASVEIADGVFKTADGIDISVKGGTEKTVTIKKGKSITPSSGKVSFKIEFSENENVFYDLINHWSYDEVMTLYREGLIKGVNECSFAPDDNITLRQILLLISRAMNIEDDKALSYALENGILSEEEARELDVFATREQIINIIANALKHIKSGEMENTSVDFSKLYLPRVIESDEEAVKCEAEAMRFESTVLSNNIVLPSSGRYGTSIKWSGGNKFLSSDGKVTYPDAESPDEKAVLTATFRRGNAECVKDFEFLVKSASTFSYQSGSFADSLISIKEQKGEFAFKFSAVPNADNVNWCIGLFDKNVVPSGYGDMALIVRFNPEGTIDAYNSSGYAAVTKIKYEENQKYLFSVNGNINSKTYSVTVTEPGGRESIIASDYRFRSTASVADNLGLMNSVVSSGRGVISDLSIAVSGEGDAHFGYVSGKEFFKITDSDIDTGGGKCVSSAPHLINNEGKIIAVPAEDTYVYFIKIPSDVRIYEDFYDATPSSYLNILNMRSLGIIKQGEDNLLRAHDNCMRAEAACIVNRFYMLLKVKNFKWQ